MRRVINETWMRAGVTMKDPDSTYVDADVTLEPDVTILPGTHLEGVTHVASGTTSRAERARRRLCRRGTAR